ncbi:MAG TPA: hypothetical protein VK497_00080 [Candidatus Saccharimonadales bacterium]|nr:hypothetical protein [Candidatus Saccharimonadales bacterium]
MVFWVIVIATLASAAVIGTWRELRGKTGTILLYGGAILLLCSTVYLVGIHFLGTTSHTVEHSLPFYGVKLSQYNLVSVGILLLEAASFVCGGVSYLCRTFVMRS